MDLLFDVKTSVKFIMTLQISIDYNYKDFFYVYLVSLAPEQNIIFSIHSNGSFTLTILSLVTAACAKTEVRIPGASGASGASLSF